MQALQQTEAKLKAMEEDFNQKNQELERLRCKADDSLKSRVMTEVSSQTTSSAPDPLVCDSSKQISVLEQQVSFEFLQD